MTLYHRKRTEKNNDCQSPRIEILKDKIRKKNQSNKINLKKLYQETRMMKLKNFKIMNPMMKLKTN